MSEKCPELKGSEKLNPGSQAAKMVCEFTNAPAPQEIAKNAVKKNEGELGVTARSLNGRGNQIEKALRDAGA